MLDNQKYPELSQSIKSLRGVGPSLTKTLGKLEIFTIGDLLKHLPTSYEDRSHIVPIKALELGQNALIEGEIVDSQLAYGKKRSLLITVSDNTGYIKIRFFHFSKNQQSALKIGALIRAFGIPRITKSGFEFAHPDYQVHMEKPPPPSDSLTPVYALTKGVGQRRMRSLTKQLVEITSAKQGVDSYETMLYLHRPPQNATDNDLREAQEKIAADELTAHYIAMKQQQRMYHSLPAIPLPSSIKLGRLLLNQLGFTLTKAQQRVLREVLEDLEKPIPMLRLLQGDVGSGKTIIAAFAAIRAAEQGRQTAIMAPTEILAEQHYLNFCNWLEPLGISVELVTGKQRAPVKRRVEQAIASGTALVAIGTHAIFQKSISFNNLSLTIIDEQHRFGVHQRMALLEKGAISHQLVMTATPIPRTLTMVLYGNMDVSVIDEQPPGRQKIDTRAIPYERREQVISAIKSATDGGQQAYWVCPLIAESDQLQLAAAETTAQMLSQHIGASSVSLLHGRMTNTDKTTVMRAFKDGKIKLLVATTVIEVGMDVPNATIMVIENPERMGLAQLHQLRGRVGRGVLPSHCILLYKNPLSEKARERLEIMRTSTDGFHIAEKDLEMRGPGELGGTRQTGEQQFRVADLAKHAHLIPSIITNAEALMRSDKQAVDLLLETWGPRSIETLKV
ncbi:MAG: ATP-dependent DNA helicase RecG [Gammaproteobacteria bacterium]|nr:ATP-dependent DNA helicase RecG [Gammaproteobacteria bacterium]